MHGHARPHRPDYHCPESDPMNRLISIFLNRFVLLPVIALLAGCATVSGPREVVLPIEKLQSVLASKLPANSRYLDLIDINVTNPRLQLNPESNRVVVFVDATVTPVIGKKVLRGSFRMSGILAIDAARQAVIVQQPRMDELTIEGMDTPVAGQLAKVGGLLAARILQNVPVYTFTPEQLRDAGVQFSPSQISTTARALVVTFAPVK